MNENLENLKQKAWQLFDDKNWDELIPICTEIIELEKSSRIKAFAYSRRYFAYVRKGNSSQAMKDFFKWQELSSKDLPAYIFPDTVYSKDDLDQEITNSTKELELSPYDEFTYHYRGVMYDKRGDLDLAIADFTKALERSPNYVLGYFYRGRTYGKKGNLDLAIADFTKALELDPNYVEAYLHRGGLYSQKGDSDRAIVDFTKALKLNPNYAEAYHYRGVTYYHKGDSDRAIADFNKALEINPDYAEARLSRGLVYMRKEDYAQAIADSDKALELESITDTVRKRAHLLRGATHFRKGKFLNAFDNFVDSNKYDPDLKFISPQNYVVSQIANIYKGSKKEDKVKAFELYLNLLHSIMRIQIKQFYNSEKGREVAHYTSLSTLKDLANEEELFRFYNAAYMNDPEEGSVFFEVIKESGINVKEVFYEEDEDPPYPSPAYIGSFIIVNSNNQEQRDELFLWRTYGKHNGQEAAGACLIFRHEGSCFAKTYEPQVGGMQRLQSEPSMVKGNLKNPGERQQSKPALYRILYMDKETKKELSEELDELAKSLKQVKRYVSKKRINKRNRLKRLARELLDNIRFLFKASHYKEEQEVRVIQFCYYDENMSQGPDGIKVDTERIPPHFYLHAHDSFRFDEVILGPEAHGLREWTQWLKKRDIKAKKSEIKYGKQSF